MELSSNNESSYQRDPAQALRSAWISLLQSHGSGGHGTGPVHLSLLSHVQLDLCLFLRLRDRRKTFLFVTRSNPINAGGYEEAGCPTQGDVVLTLSYLLDPDIFIGLKPNQHLSVFLIHFFPKGTCIFY